MNFLPYPVEIVTGSGQIAMVYEWGGFRSIDMTGNAPQPDYPLLMGRGTGTWQGDTLIAASPRTRCSMPRAALLPKD